jgi:hypothetical protein
MLSHVSKGKILRFSWVNHGLSQEEPGREEEGRRRRRRRSFTT